MDKRLGLTGLVVGQKSGGGPSHLPQKMSRGLVDALAGVPLFAGLSRRHLTRIAGLASSKRYAAGSALVKAGAPGESVFVILDGRAQPFALALVASALGSATSSARCRCSTASPDRQPSPPRPTCW
jgi:hypothetical protein